MVIWSLRGLWIVALLFGILPTGQAAERPVGSIPIVFPDMQEVNTRVLALPFSRAGNLILVKAKADTTEGNFVLDTGCPHLVLNLTYFRHYPQQESSQEGNGATAGSFSVSHTRVADFSFGNDHFYQVEADLTDLGSIENSRNIRVLGLLGVALLRHFEVIIDYEENLIYLHRLSRKGSSLFEKEFLADTAAYSVVPIRLTDNRIFVDMVAGGKKLKLIIDSGSEANLLDSRLPDKVFADVTITGRTRMAGVGGKTIDVMRGDWKGVTIGDRELGTMPVLVTNLEKTCFSHAGCADGVLGFDFLSLRKIGFNFVKNKMYLWK